MELKHVLSKKILEDSDFAGLNSVVALDGEKATHAISSHLYELNT